jgi:hypothetical protein
MGPAFRAKIVMRNQSKWFLGFVTICAVLLGVAIPSEAQSNTVPSRITQAIDPANLTILQGNTHPLAEARFDRGAAPGSLPMQRMLLVLKRSPQQESALESLLEQQQDASSPNYRHWLTPQQFGQQFGPSDQDIQTITSWLQSQGFEVDQISNGRTAITFSGTAGEVQSAFHTAIHQYFVNGENHFANFSEPAIPAALTPVVAGVASLNSFRKKPLYHLAGIFSRSGKTGPVRSIRPEFTFNGCQFDPSTGQYVPCYPLAPYDFATIYNVTPLWNASPAIDGTGQTIAIIGRTNINLQDVSQFRALFGLPANPPTVILNGPDPGILPSDETEADLDVEWSGAVAKAATIDLVVSQSTESTDGVDLSALYIVDNNLAPVMSESYGECELGLGTAGNQFEANLWQQAAAEGITVFVAAGDDGSAGCDPFQGQSPQPAVNGLQVSGLASTPYDVAVGGTDFDDFFNATNYWNSTNDPTTQASAKGYIPETTWNDTCTNAIFGKAQIGFSTNPETNCNNSQLSNFVFTIAGSGGASKCTNPTGSQASACTGGYSKPSWQSGTGVPSDGKRDIPDVSLFASNGFVGNFYMLCEDDIIYGTCSTSNFAGVGGTSASSPAFAGIMAMVNQATASRQGNANYAFYKLAGQSGSRCTSAANPASTCVFFDIPGGSTIAVPCSTASPNCTTQTSGDQYGILSGYGTTTAYDEATGLGSVNAANLVTAWKSFALNLKSSSTILTLTPPSGGSLSNLTHGQTVTFSTSVSAVAPATGTPTGTVALMTNTGTSGQQAIQSVTLNSSGSGSGSTNALPGGTYNVIANYPGDGTFGSSQSSGTSVTVNPENSETKLGIVTFDPTTGQITNTNTSSFNYGSPYILRADVTNSSGSTCFNSSSQVSSYGCPTGTVNLTDNGSPLGPGTLTLNSQGYTEFQAVQLTGGAHTLGGSYSGDASYNASAATDAITVNPAPTTTTITYPSPAPNPPLTVIIGSPFTMDVSTNSQSNGAAPGGNYSVTDGSTQIPVTTVYIDRFAATASLAAWVSAYLEPTVSGPSGTHKLTAHYSGDANYASSDSGTVTVNALYPTTMSLAVNPNNIVLGDSVTLTATLSTTNPASDAALKPTGGITFNSNYGSISGTVTTTVTQDSNGNWIEQAKITITPQQPETVTASFGGDSNYAASSAGMMVNVTIPDFSVSANPPTMAITAGQTGTATITITPATNYTSTVTLQCPLVSFWGGTCSISPSSVTLQNGVPVTATLSIATLAPSTNLSALSLPGRFHRPPFTPSNRGEWWALSAAAAFASLLLFLLPSKQRTPIDAIGFAVIALLSFTVGCGGGASGNQGGGGGGPVPTSTAITASATKIAPGSTLTLSANVTSTIGVTGGVTFGSNCNFSQTATLLNGTAQMQIPPGVLGVGTCTFTATYGGDFTHNPSTSGGLNITVTGNSSVNVLGSTSIDSHAIQMNVALQ